MIGVFCTCFTRRIKRTRPFFLLSFKLAVLILVSIGIANADSSVPDPFANENSAQPSSGVTHYFRSLVDNQKEQAQALVEVASGRNLLTFGAIGITTLVLISQDDRIDRSMRNLQEGRAWIYNDADRVTGLGGYYGIAGVIGFGTYGFLSSDLKAQETTLLTSQALITSGLWTQLLKVAAGRKRPGAEYDVTHTASTTWSPFEMLVPDKHAAGSSFNSFPSGHTTVAFSIATVVAEQYADKPAVPVIAYATAGLVGISRMLLHAHWASDVFLGGAIGYACAEQIVSRHRRSDKQAWNVAITPYPGNAAGMVTVQFNW